MNTPFRFLITGSLAALLCAIVGALWLVWHSLQESRQLERQNRELQASLEASRIRVENFCEYPVDALCKVDARTGSVAAVMTGESPDAMPRPASALDADPSLAVKHQKAVAAVQSLLAAADVPVPSAPAAPAAAEKPKATKEPAAIPAQKTVPAQKDGTSERRAPAEEKATSPEQKEPAAHRTTDAPQKKKTDAPAAVQEQKKPVAATVTPPAPAVTPAPSAAVAPSVPAPSVSSPKPAPSAKPAPVTTEAPATAPQNAASVSPEPATARPIPAVPSVPAPVEKAAPAPSDPVQGDAPTDLRPSISGKLVFHPEDDAPADTPAPKKAPEQEAKAQSAAPAPKAPQKAEPTAAPSAVTSAAPVQKKAKNPGAFAETPRKSWSSIEHDGTNFGFTITGAGDALPASGRLVAKPWRYELTLKGNWAVQTHAKVENRLVKRMTVAKEGDSTVITFHLKQKPYRCSLHRPDKRTATVRIR